MQTLDRDEVVRVVHAPPDAVPINKAGRGPAWKNQPVVTVAELRDGKEWSAARVAATVEAPEVTA